jgi:NAD(P)-dependent dehydrogenase (short-subunit alcohol dehydrogenase family)
MGDVLKGKGAIVTGGGGGIGRVLSIALAAEGAKVVVVDPGVGRDGAGSSEKPADLVVEEIKKAGGEALASYESITDFNAAERIVKSCVDTFGSLDILINVAGILRERMIFNMSEEDWDAVLAVHLKGTWNMSRHASAVMRQQKRGRIINTTSGAWLGSAGQSNYVAAKGAIVSLSRAIAIEMGRYGVTCNAIDPMAATRMTLTEEVKAGFIKRYEEGSLTKEQLDERLNIPPPEGITPFVVYLASDDSGFMNGEVFHIRSGRVALYSRPEQIKTIFKDGEWTVEELKKLVPGTIGAGLVNPSPPKVE